MSCFASSLTSIQSESCRFIINYQYSKTENKDFVLSLTLILYIKTKTLAYSTLMRYCQTDMQLSRFGPSGPVLPSAYMTRTHLQMDWGMDSYCGHTSINRPQVSQPIYVICTCALTFINQSTIANSDYGYEVENVLPK